MWNKNESLLLFIRETDLQESVQKCSTKLNQKGISREIFCITDSDAQRSAQKHCSSLGQSFRLSFLVIGRYGGVSLGRQGVLQARRVTVLFCLFQSHT
jgi:hypothetical protein